MYWRATGEHINNSIWQSAVSLKFDILRAMT